MICTLRCYIILVFYPRLIIINHYYVIGLQLAALHSVGVVLSTWDDWRRYEGGMLLYNSRMCHHIFLFIYTTGCIYGRSSWLSAAATRMCMLH